MLNDNYCVAGIFEAVETSEEAPGVRFMKADGGLIKNVNGPAEPVAKLGGQPDPLGLPP